MRKRGYRHRHAAVVIDDVVFPLAGTVLRFEEDYGGHELTAKVPRDGALFATMKGGRAMAVRVDNLTTPSFSLECAAMQWVISSLNAISESGNNSKL